MAREDGVQGGARSHGNRRAREELARAWGEAPWEKPELAGRGAEHREQRSGHGRSSAAWELGAPALPAVAAVSREEERGRLEKRKGEWQNSQVQGERDPIYRRSPRVRVRVSQWAKWAGLGLAQNT